ncbi:hypothetical protein D3C73_1291060 [compost metagenome]
MVLMIRCIVEKSGIERPVGCFVQFIQPFTLHFIMLGIGHVSVNRLAVRINNRRHIVDGLHPPFNLEAVNSRFDQIRNVLQHA